MLFREILTSLGLEVTNRIFSLIVVFHPDEIMGGNSETKKSNLNPHHKLKPLTAQRGQLSMKNVILGKHEMGSIVYTHIQLKLDP